MQSPVHGMEEPLATTHAGTDQLGSSSAEKDLGALVGQVECEPAPYCGRKGGQQQPGLY